MKKYFEKHYWEYFYDEVLKKYFRKYRKDVFLIIFSILIVLFLYYLNYILLYPRKDRAEIGDMFGAVNALFTGLAFGGVLITIYLQREDLILTRQELKNQNDTIRRQNFENTFFQLLSLHNDIVNSITINDYIENKTYRGRESFEYLLKMLNNEYEYIKKTEKIITQDSEIVTIAYETFFKKYQSRIGHYIRNLYFLYKYIHGSDIKIYKKRYTDIATAQLSTFELTLLFYNGLSIYWVDDFKPLIEIYQLFNHLDPELLLNKQHTDWYPRSAYTTMPVIGDV